MTSNIKSNFNNSIIDLKYLNKNPNTKVKEPNKEKTSTTNKKLNGFNQQSYLFFDIKKGSANEIFPLGNLENKNISNIKNDNRVNFNNKLDYIPGEDLNGSLYWTPGGNNISGSEGNNIITNKYHELDNKFTLDYLGEEGISGEVASWLTFAKSGSGSAGVQVGNIETALSAIKQISDDYSNPKRDSKALEALSEMMSKPDMPNQFALLGEKIINDGLENIDKDFIKLAISEVNRMRSALVEGNTEIYKNSVPLFVEFMKAEEENDSGLKRVSEMLNNPEGMYSPKSVKKQLAYHYGVSKLNQEQEAFAETSSKQYKSLILSSFSKYKQAHELYEKANLPNIDSETSKNMIEKRDSLIKEANLEFVTFEQLFAQPIYDKIHDITGYMTGTIKLFDANNNQNTEGITLLPNLGTDNRYEGNIDIAENLIKESRPKEDGNWADFMTRMGFVETDSFDNKAKKLTIQITEPNENGSLSRKYETKWLKPDPNLLEGKKGLTTNGTISDYFINTKDGKETKSLIFSDPPKANLKHKYSLPESDIVKDTSKVSNYLLEAFSILTFPIVSTPVIIVKHNINNEFKNLERENKLKEKSDKDRIKALEIQYQ